MSQSITRKTKPPKDYPDWKNRTLAKLRISNGLTVERLQLFLWGQTAGSETERRSYTDKRIEPKSRCCRFLNWLVKQGDIEIEYTKPDLTLKAKVWAKGTRVKAKQIPEAPRPGFELKVTYDPGVITRSSSRSSKRRKEVAA